VVEQLSETVYIPRPANVEADAAGFVFVLDQSGDAADRRRVKFGKAALDRIEVREGIKSGESVILSDMSRFEHVTSVRLR
jgi:multidrug efflux pump subunit AcrA (membrane-fusion protein)